MPGAEDRLYTDADLRAKLRRIAEGRKSVIHAREKLIIAEAAEVASQLTKLREAAREALATLDQDLVDGSPSLLALQAAVHFAGERTHRPD